MSPNSLEQMATIMVKAKKLPAKAIRQLSKAVTKHGGNIAGTEVKIDSYPTRVGSLFEHAKDGRVEVPLKPEMLTETLVLISIKKDHNGTYGHGWLFLNSVHPMHGTERILKYRVAVNFMDKTLKKIQALLKVNGDMYNKPFWINGKTNLIKDLGKSGNPTVHSYDLVEVDDPEHLIDSWM